MGFCINSTELEVVYPKEYIMCRLKSDRACQQWNGNNEQTEVGR